MRPLIITFARHAVPGCCKSNATGLDRLFYSNEWLIDDVCLSSGWRSCEEYDLCPVQDIEMAVDWSSAVMRGSITMSNLPIGGASPF